MVDAVVGARARAHMQGQTTTLCASTGPPPSAATARASASCPSVESAADRRLTTGAAGTEEAPEGDAHTAFQRLSPDGPHSAPKSDDDARAG